MYSREPMNAEQLSRNRQAVERLFHKTAVKSGNLPEDALHHASVHSSDMHILTKEKDQKANTINQYYRSLYTAQQQRPPEFSVHHLCSNNASLSPLDIPSHINRQLRASASIAKTASAPCTAQSDHTSTLPSHTFSVHMETDEMANTNPSKISSILGMPLVREVNNEVSYTANTLKEANNDNADYVTSDGNTSSSNFALRVQIAKHAVCIPKFENDAGHYISHSKADATENKNYNGNIETRHVIASKNNCCNNRKLTKNNNNNNRSQSVDKGACNVAGTSVNQENELAQCGGAYMTLSQSLSQPKSRFTLNRLTHAECDKLRRASLRHERAVNRYEQTLAQRRVMDDYVAACATPGNNTSGRIRPNRALASQLTTVHHGKWPLDNAHRQQLLNGEPLLTRLLRGEFYEGAQLNHAKERHPTKPRNFVKENRRTVRAMSAQASPSHLPYRNQANNNNNTTGKP